MPFKVFQYPLPLVGDTADLNQWLATHRVLSLKQYCVSLENTAVLVFVVETLEANATGQQNPQARSRIDYKEVLSPEDFDIYSELRVLRKAIANEEGIPVYSVFSNAQLASMVLDRVGTLAAMGGIEQVGQARIDKYGAAFLEVLSKYPQMRSGA